MVNETQFIAITDTVIDKLEGGYYHPNMLSDGRVKDRRYAASGETMLGIDRKNAASALVNSSAWILFWGKIDAVDAKNKWSWNYKGGELYPYLRTLAGKMMYPEYKRLYSKYLSAESQSLVDRDSRLIFNFAYASWNGEGWFKRWAELMNNEVAKGNKDLNSLVDILVKARSESTNSLISQGGKKIASFIQSINFAIVDVVKKNPKTTIVVVVGVIALSVYGFFYLKKVLK